MDEPPTAEQYLKKVQDIIERHGWFVQSVMPDEDAPAFSYSIGLWTRFRHPEIFMSGFRPELMHGLINDVAERLSSGSRFDQDLQRASGIIKGFDIAFRTVDRSVAATFALFANDVQGEGFDTVQLCLPDAQGRFPWDPGCDPRLAEMQMILSCSGWPGTAARMRHS
jgi:hypothetical protein